MKENSAAKSLQIVGWLEVIASVIVGLFVDTVALFGVDISLVIMAGGIITFCILQGFAEIIELLDRSVKKQDSIIELLEKKSSEEPKKTNEVQRNIASNKHTKSKIKNTYGLTGKNISIHNPTKRENNE